MTGDDLSNTAAMMLLDAEVRIGGIIGTGNDRAWDELRAANLIGPRGGLTRPGLVKHFTIGVAHGRYAEEELW